MCVFFNPYISVHTFIAGICLNLYIYTHIYIYIYIYICFGIGRIFLTFLTLFFPYTKNIWNNETKSSQI